MQAGNEWLSKKHSDKIQVSLSRPLWVRECREVVKVVWMEYFYMMCTRLHPLRGLFAFASPCLFSRMWRAIICSAIFLLCGGGLLHAQSLILNDLVVDNSNGTMTVHYGVLVEDAPAIEQALSEGLKLRFIGHVALYEKRSLWWNEFLVENNFVCDLREDTLKQEVVLVIDDQETRFPMSEFARVFQERLEHLVTPLGPWSMVDKKTTYIVRLTLTMSRIDVPVWIRVPLFFWSWDLVPETTFEMEFAY